MRRLRVESSDDNNGVGMGEGDELPDRPGEPDCIYYLRTGTCAYGSNCRFNHPSNGYASADGVTNTGELSERLGQPDCGHYLKTGTCKYGSSCKYYHPKDRQLDSSVLPNILGLPMRPDAMTCNYYMRTGFCKYGYACKFHHPQPSSTTNVVPAVEPVYDSGSTAVVPSSGGELPTASLPKAAFFSSFILQLPQSYMPLVLSPSQGWNTYMGSFSPYSMTSMVATPSSNGQLSVSFLPERPDQPECRYFMNYGICKYGAVCKYHHPREKVSELASSSLGPLGLPLRPGQPVCLYYYHYGLCKYGPTCKFNHPRPLLLDGYSYAYNLSVPFPSSPQYQHIPPSQTSPSKPSNLRDWMIKEGETSLGDSPHSLPNLHESLSI